MSLAIVIPYYKINYFKETLDSLSRQTDKRFKVYIGNDNSPNTPEDLLKNIEFDFVYKIYDKNFGGNSLVKQWNRCLELLNDEKWVSILGDDDVLSENFVEEFYNNIKDVEERAIKVIRYATQKINGKSEAISKVFKNEVVESSIDFLFKKKRSSLSEYIFEKKQIQKIGFKAFPLAWYSDVLAVLEFSNFSEVLTINSALAKIRVSNYSISGLNNNQREKELARFYFYKYLLTEKQDYFSPKQKIVLLKRLNKSFLNNKRQIKLFFLISKIHFSSFQMQFYPSFLNDIFIVFKVNKKVV